MSNLGIELGLATSPLANFGQGHVWDVQRYQSADVIGAFRDAASIYIGIYGAAAGIPEAMMQNIQNDYAFYKSKFVGQVMDGTYKYLPAVNVANVDIGYQLVQQGLVHQ